jgi:uncharacterized protein
MRLPAASLLASLLLALPAQQGVAQARTLATPVEELVEVELASVGINPLTGSPVVLLRAVEHGDLVPIFIGVNEARAILMAMHETPVARPMTHDLMRDLLGAMDARLERVFVDDLANGTYFGMLELSVAGREAPVRVDTRPSDALALAVRTGATILVAPKILQAGQDLDYEALPEDQVVTALGITVIAVTPRLRETLGLPPRPGLLVNRSAGPAAKAGLNPGSLLLEVNGRTPASPMDLLELVRSTPAGESVEILYWQDGREERLELAPDAGRALPDREADAGREITT